ncbi:MAG TPA: hypothetical protein VGF42_03535, partial [Caulobacteraceae bacterium]
TNIIALRLTSRIALCDHWAMMIDTHEQEDAAAEAAADPAVLRAEKRLRCLEEIAEIGMALIRALRPSAEAEDVAAEVAGSPRRRDPVDHYASLSRTLRLTFALEAKTDQDLIELKADVTHIRQRERRLAAWSQAAAADESGGSRRAEVRRCARAAADREAESPEQLDNFYLAIEQRLAEDIAYSGIEARPLRESVERLCLDVCLYPDWRRWTGSGWSEEIWVGPQQTGRQRYSRFGHSSPRPIWGDKPDHDLE